MNNNKDQKLPLTGTQKFQACILAGFDGKTLSQCNSATITIACIIGCTILIPTALSFVGMSRIAEIFTDTWYYVAISSIAFAGIVFLIDKGILATSGINDGFLKILFRITLSLISSTVITLPFKVEFFSDEINVQLKIDMMEEEQEIRVTYQELINTVQNEITLAQTRLDERYQELKEEIDGSARSRRRGYGKIARIKMAEHKKEEERFKAFSLVKNTQINDLMKQRDQLVTELYKRETRLFTKIKALYSIKDKTITFWIIMITLFVVGIELTPLIIKLSGRKQLESYYTACQRNSEASIHAVESTNEDNMKTQKQKRQDEFKSERLQNHINQVQELCKSENMRADTSLSHIAYVTTKANAERKKIMNSNMTLKEKKAAIEELNFIKDSCLAVVHAQTHNTNSFYDRRYTKHDDDEFDMVLYPKKRA